MDLGNFAAKDVACVDTDIREKSCGNAKQHSKSLRLKENCQRLNVVADHQPHPPMSYRSDDRNSGGHQNMLGPIDGNLIRSRELELQHCPQTSNDGLDGFLIASLRFALHVRANKCMKAGMRLSTLDVQHRIVPRCRYFRLSATFRVVCRVCTIQPVPFGRE